jgi:hypothetical protein
LDQIWFFHEEEYAFDDDDIEDEVTMMYEEFDDERCVVCEHSSVYQDYLIHLECSKCKMSVCEVCVDGDLHTC